METLTKNVRQEIMEIDQLESIEIIQKMFREDLQS